MKKFVLVGAIALLAACGSSKSGVSNSPSGSGDTVSVADIGDMPPQCIELLSKYLKTIEPTVSKVDWSKATLAELEALGTQFQTESDTFDADSTSKGCDKYSITGSDDAQLKQVIKLAAAKAPGTVKFLTFISSLSNASTSNAGAIPADCAGTIAAIEPYLGKGKTMKDLTVTEITQLGALMSGVGTNCTAEEAGAFYARADVQAFVSG